MPRRLISIPIIICLTFSQAAQANTQAWLPQRPAHRHGKVTETIRLANIKAGKGINVDATGGVMVDIPEVPAEPTPPAGDAIHTGDSADHEHANNVQLTPEEKATRAAEDAKAAEDKRARDKQRFNDHINTLASKPGQEWIGQLARKAKEKPGTIGDGYTIIFQTDLLG